MKPSGLTTAEAQSLFLKYGPNEITTKSDVSPTKIFLGQFLNAFIAILTTASLLAFYTGDFLEGFLILAITILNAIFGFFQEYRAEKALESLKDLIVDKVRVIRDGIETNIDSTLLVPGDLVVLEEGKKITADGKLFETSNLQINESSLTGESEPITKLEDGKKEEEFLVFMGTVVEKGHGIYEVSETGMRTRFGRIAELVKTNKSPKTGLEKQLAQLSVFIGFFAVGISILFFLVSFLHQKPFTEIAITSISLAAAVVPEGLPIVVTITLAIGVQRMVRKNALVRKLPAIETLGAINLICTDKTGTLTENRMRVKELLLDGEIYSVDSLPTTASLAKLIEVGIWCNNANLVLEPQSQKFEILGDQTEGSLLVLAKSLGIDIDQIKNGSELVEDFGFDTQRKLMSVVVKKNDNYQLLTKGAPDSILRLCKQRVLNDKIADLTEQDVSLIEERISDLADKGLRTLALAQKDLGKDFKNKVNLETDLVFLGVVGIADPPRAEVKGALEQAHNAGIKVVMVTGDSERTAIAIGKEVGLLSENSEVVNSKDLPSLTDQQLIERIDNIAIFARSTPEDKLRIVNLYRSKGYRVAVTGDGVNDAPALTVADVGIAMGISGTDVAKESADIVLTDDNFSSIIAAVGEGRVVYDNIIKATRFLLTGNLSELVTIFGAAIIGLPSPITAAQILWINLVTDGLPALALASDPKDPKAMSRKPRTSDSIFDSLNLNKILTWGLLGGIAGIAIFVFLQQNFDLTRSQNLTFTFIVFFQMVVAFSFKNSRSIFSNPFLLYSILVIIGLQLLVTNVRPFSILFGG